ncbi:MAG: PDZ domain-containing protein [Ruminococcaceae bacterium]|nr:PDZ domain-containing protein [Oscillospiraceae bacterium]
MYENNQQNSYTNGSTKPPKNRGGIIAVVLCILIVLVGVVSLIGSVVDFTVNLDDVSNVLFSDDKTPTSAPTVPTQMPVNPDNQTQIELSPIPGQVDNVPQAGGLGLQDIYDKNIPSVVSITCTFSGGSGSGTGVVLSQNGYLVTNAHVVDGAQSIQVLLTDGRTFTARLVGADTLSDLAVLYINTNDLVPAQFGDSSQLRVGDAVVAIGDPLGVAFRGTMTDGIVSAINRDVVSGGRTMTLIQTNAALNSGNSGGPLINCFGQVIGINTMKIGIFADDAGVEGLGFAIPSVIVQDIVNQLISQGYVSGRPALELTGQWVSSFDQIFRRIPAGLYITEAPENSEIRAGDILLSVDQARVTSEEELEKALYSHKAGDTVTLTMYRSGSQYTTTITLTEAGK